MKILNGDCLTELKKLPDCSVQMCVTSPPYYGLRDYGTANWVGGDEKCPHKYTKSMPSEKSTVGQRSNREYHHAYKTICDLCGAIRQDQQIGLEETPETYIQKLVEVFKEVKRVLKDDGTLWLNLGDSYASNGCYIKSWSERHPEKQHLHTQNRERYGEDKKGFRGGEFNIKAKDLLGIPWRVAFALQADGWYLRQDIIWAKPNPMPESVTDRCTKSHEYIFLLAKNQKYYFDNEAIKEPDHPDGRRQTIKKQTNRYNGVLLNKFQDNEHERWTGKRNKRSVWTITTKPFKEAHFATFPEDLIEPCILAGSKNGDVVLDCFFGAGTTGVVAKKLGRDCIGIELNPKYCKMAQKRIQNTQGTLFDLPKVEKT